MKKLIFLFIALGLVIGSCKKKDAKDASNDKEKTEQTRISNSKTPRSGQQRAKSSSPAPPHEQLGEFGIGKDNRNVLGGLKVGAPVPIFNTKDDKGNTINLSTNLSEGPVVLVFYRGQWSPDCNKYLSELGKSMNKFTDLGASIIAITPEKKENVKITKSNTGINFPIISDRSMSLMKAYKVSARVSDQYVDEALKNLEADIARNNGRNDAFLPIPATYIIGQDRSVQYIHYDPDFKNRPSVSELTNVLKQL